MGKGKPRPRRSVEPAPAAHPVGAAGAAASEGTVDDAAEDAYWRINYRTASYVHPGRSYAYYEPAYRFGWEARGRYGPRGFDELEEQLAKDWTSDRGRPRRAWGEVRNAVRDAWEHAALARAHR